MDYFAFNSKNPLHKSRYGALKQGDSVTFRIILPRSCQVSGVCLVISRDRDSFSEKLPFSWEGMQGDSEEWWRLEYTAPEHGLFWYSFEYYTPTGAYKITKADKGLGIMSDSGERWQLTVYSADFETPRWLRGGIIYQIFPDRFCASGKKKKGVPSDRVQRTVWGGYPEWRPDSDGIVKNNDFFGGDLAGITSRLPYLRELGVSCVYLNPIFESHSNHRYDTADYEKIDPMLGNEEDFKKLCREAEKLGIYIMLDGVFSHTGADSRYFNKYGRYGEGGAYRSRQSEFYNWYTFKSWPDVYSSWWNFDTLPEVDETDDSYLKYITGENGIARKWLRLGARGWRLDVADELPDAFLDAFCAAVKAEKPDAPVLGEVWEDASNKISYSSRRRYLLGGQLDSVMNYPFCQAILDFVKTGVAEGFSDKILSVLENYPPQVVHVLMNHIGTHDTMRAITYLAGNVPDSWGRREKSTYRLSSDSYAFGVKLLKLASLIQYTLPGVPSLYYGDEAGMQGCSDPFNRACYPWGKEDAELVHWYKQLGAFRRRHSVFVDGAYATVSEMLGCLAYRRSSSKEEIMIIVNRNSHPIDYRLPDGWQNAKTELCGVICDGNMHIDALGAAVAVRR